MLRDYLMFPLLLSIWILFFIGLGSAHWAETDWGHLGLWQTCGGGECEMRTKYCPVYQRNGCPSFDAARFFAVIAWIASLASTLFALKPVRFGKLSTVAAFIAGISGLIAFATFADWFRSESDQMPALTGKKWGYASVCVIVAWILSFVAAAVDVLVVWRMRAESGDNSTHKSPSTSSSPSYQGAELILDDLDRGGGDATLKQNVRNALSPILQRGIKFEQIYFYCGTGSESILVFESEDAHYFSHLSRVRTAKPRAVLVVFVPTNVHQEQLMSHPKFEDNMRIASPLLAQCVLLPLTRAECYEFSKKVPNKLQKLLQS